MSTQAAFTRTKNELIDDIMGIIGGIILLDETQAGLIRLYFENIDNRLLLAGELSELNKLIPPTEKNQSILIGLCQDWLVTPGLTPDEIELYFALDEHCLPTNLRPLRMKMKHRTGKLFSEEQIRTLFKKLTPPFIRCKS